MKHCHRRGMGAPELLGALVVLILVAFLSYSYANHRSAAGKRGLTIQRLLAIEDALAKYVLDCGGQLPTPEQTLMILVIKPEKGAPAGWRGPYLPDETVLRDGWGREFKYYSPGGPVERGSTALRPYELASYGRDGAEGGKGLDRDIRSADRSSLVP